MRQLTQDEIDYILKQHKRWFMSLPCPKGKRADFCNANLCGADFSGMDLRFADFSFSALHEANFSDANLSGANFRNARLDRANLSFANLSRADLFGARLVGASFYQANLTRAFLTEAILGGTIDFRGAFFYDACLTGVDFSTVDLSDTAELPPIVCPSDGGFIGWKKAYALSGNDSDYVLVKLYIPADAKRSSATGRKCRASKAKVLKIMDIKNPKITYPSAQSIFDYEFIYRVGETVTPSSPFYENRWEECGPGIHFFMTKEEALSYNA